MNVLFWNLNKRPLLHLVRKLVDERRIDVVALAEFCAKAPEILLALNEDLRSPKFVTGAGIMGRVLIAARVPVGYVQPLDDIRFASSRRIKSPAGGSFNLIGVHLSSKRYKRDAEQWMEAPRIREAIGRAEQVAGDSRTIVVGDLNMNPFEPGVVAADGLHALMSRDLALKATRVVGGETRACFYNPMWGHFGDRFPGPPGTYYYDASAQIQYFWNIFDQVLVRPSLLPSFDEKTVEIVSVIDGRSLLTEDGKPDIAFASDHLPLVFAISERH